MINGPGDDRCPAWTPDLRIFLFDSVRASGFGARDIWWVYFEDVKGHPSTATTGSSAPLEPGYLGNGDFYPAFVIR